MGFPVAAGNPVNSSDINDLDSRIGNTVESIAVDSVDTSETTSSSTYTDLATAGPSVTVTCPSSKAIVTITARMFNATQNDFSAMSFVVSGASTVAAQDGNALQFEPATANARHQASSQIVLTNLSTGSNTFTAKYRVESGGSTGTFSHRDITVFPLGG